MIHDVFGQKKVISICISYIFIICNGSEGEKGTWPSWHNDGIFLKWLSSVGLAAAFGFQAPVKAIDLEPTVPSWAFSGISLDRFRDIQSWEAGFLSQWIRVLYSLIFHLGGSSTKAITTWRRYCFLPKRGITWAYKYAWHYTIIHKSINNIQIHRHNIFTHIIIYNLGSVRT